MPETTEIVELTPQHTLPGMLARLRAADAERVLLAVPVDLTLSAVDLRLLYRAAFTRGIGLALVTDAPALRAEAKRAGISTFRTAAGAERARWRKLRGDSADGLRATGPSTVAAPFGAGLYSRLSPTKFQPRRFERSFVRWSGSWWSLLGSTLFLLLLLTGLLFALAAVIPAATISLTSASEPIQVTVDLLAIPDAVADTDAGIVPARVLSVQVSGEARIPTTGRRMEPDAKATGQIVLINRTSRPLAVASGTVVATATGNNVRFVTTAEAPLAPNGRAVVPIEAILPGPSGNVRAGTITRVEGTQALSLLVANDTPTSGGTMAQVGVVTVDDKNQLQSLLFEELKHQAFELLNQRVEPGSFIPVDSVTYLALSPTFTPFEGEVSPDLFLSMSVQAVGLVVDMQVGNQVAMGRLQAVMPPGTRLISDTVRFIPGSVVVEDNTVDFSITAEGVLLWGVDATAVRAVVTNMMPDAAARALQERFPLAEPPRIVLGPDWLPYVVPTRLPLFPWRIRVDVDWDRAAMLAMRR